MRISDWSSDGALPICVYTDDRSLDETISVEDGDVVMVPRGYHPVGAPHGYDLYYLNVMAGPQRRWVFRNDPEHEWIVHQAPAAEPDERRSEEHTSELQSLMRISYAVFCLKKKTIM